MLFLGLFLNDSVFLIVCILWFQIRRLTGTLTCHRSVNSQGHLGICLVPEKTKQVKINTLKSYSLNAINKGSILKFQFLFGLYLVYWLPNDCRVD